MNITKTISVYILWIMFLVFSTTVVAAQSMITINMAPIDGISLIPANILNYQIQASQSENVTITGSIRYRNSNMNMSYSFNYSLKEGINIPGRDEVNPRWQFSSSALQELFFIYKSMPSGTFEYCVTITPTTATSEINRFKIDECLYHRADDIFLINLIDPTNKSKIQEYNPLLTWIANYTFSNELTYRVRVAEIKQGQNPINAIMRNQPIYDEKNLSVNSVVYPVYAKPLIVNQPYAWTVDGYYKDILLGGAETWQFIIVDSEVHSAKSDRSYIDIKREGGLNTLSALGGLKLKYVLEDAQTDSLFLDLVSEKNKQCSLKPHRLNAVYGDNRYVLDLTEAANLKHNMLYTLTIRTKTRHIYKLSFRYLNPAFQH